MHRINHIARIRHVKRTESPLNLPLLLSLILLKLEWLTLLELHGAEEAASWRSCRRSHTGGGGCELAELQAESHRWRRLRAGGVMPGGGRRRAGAVRPRWRCR